MDPNDQDLIARTIVGEAANQPPEGQQAVANVILNRLRSGKFGASARDVVLAPYQFEPWQTRRAELEALRPEAPAYQNALRALQAAQTADPTGGATHFLQPDIVRQRRGGTLPNWAQGQSTRIGDHLFFNPGGGGPRTVASASAGAPQAAVAPAPVLPPVLPPAQPNDLGSALSMMALAVPDEEQPLTRTPNRSQIHPFAGAVEEDVDTSVFQPRTTKRPSQAAPRRA